ncbi:MAG: prolipoprotein diacylglyceryl transferase [Proteobacteria bacterium]|nr:prolipoprotein diacylglyceryl transferase [Pseudomonadota bacterium]
MHEAALTFPNIDPVLIKIWGPIAIRWYSLSYVALLLIGWWAIVRMLHEKALWTNPPFKGKPPATADDIGDFVVWITFGVILGGRLGWVIFYGTILCSVSPQGAMCGGLPGEFLTNPIRIISAWDGGMSFHGGLIGVIIATLWFTHRRKLSTLQIGDLLCVVAPIGMFLVRMANFINGELWGRPTNEPWGMVFCNETVKRLHNGNCPAGDIARHPSQLYEAALEGILLFIIMQIGLRVFRWHERPGVLAGVMFLCYGLFRVFVEFFREPDAPFLGPITMGQMLSSLMWAAGAFLIWYALWRKPALPAKP